METKTYKPLTHSLDGTFARAFNQGCDARLAGLSLSANPYPTSEHEASSWRTGWLDANHCWGRGVKDRWEFKPLPEAK